VSISPNGRFLAVGEVGNVSFSLHM
jgi:hypothetical protein